MSIVFLAGAGQALAQTRAWSIETSLTFPIVKIYMVQISCPLSDHTNLLLGLCYQNWKDQGEAKGCAHAYTFILGCRQMIGERANIEIELFPAYNSFISSVDSAVYNGFETWIEYRAGYKFDLNDKFYIIPQPGLGHALYLQNIWPGMNRDTYMKNSLMFVPQITVGSNY